MFAIFIHTPSNPDRGGVFDYVQAVPNLSDTYVEPILKAWVDKALEDETNKDDIVVVSALSLNTGDKFASAVTFRTEQRTVTPFLSNGHQHPTIPGLDPLE